MGVFSGLVTLPLAPVRGVVWVAARIHDEAHRQLYDPEVIKERLQEVAEARDSGELSEEEAAREEDELVRRLMSQGPPGGGMEV
ncbi:MULTISPECIES: gas vesicle protein GvpG [Streptomyces]|uniref:Gas vesicle protein n=1 Tax=Streptomyces hygroscopicus TaxID=1912 RepID=A0ABQ3UD79_STRHY|nr:MULTISPECIES: gas vesicle protein GvpG [Streptomyces]MBW8086774.1 gas vesicle protein GvpG [Streptomyces hygroscopicus subsp. hygroscopicus]MCO8307135.1 gas vesicle protein GvpG [Streptomyces sp. RKCA744]MDN3054056.1 gas vesicle protein GvpG [Streptomyces sp. SRF1]GHJ33126.1 gas vesicle protein [Streptomyces hygroscopicus]